MKRGLVAVILASAPLLGCASGREPGAETVLAPRAASPGDTVIMGRVTPEGLVMADTVTGQPPENIRIERETVFAGVLTPADEEPTDEEPTSIAPAADAGPWRVQVHAARDRPTADALATRLGDEIDQPVRVDHEGGWHKVRVGGYASRGEAEGLRRRLVSGGWAEAFVVRVR